MEIPRRSSSLCPQCNEKITLKDVRKLYASPVIVVDENSRKKVESLGAENKSLEAENRCLKTERANLLDIQDSLLKELRHLKEMADHIPHDGVSLRVEDEPDIMPLPPRIRLFDPERYHPQEHILPPSTFHHFTDFARRAPADLLLQEPESHLSHHAREVASRFTRGYGSIIAREWYTELPDDVRQLVDEAGFGPFCTGLSCLAASRTLLGALVERWWDTTNSFHFSATGDMTMTPYDFAMLTGLDAGGQSIPYDSDMGEWEAAWTYLLGAYPPIYRSSGSVRYTWFTEQYRGTVPETVEATEQYARGFLIFLLGTTLFSNRGNTVGLHLLSALVDLSQVRHFDWGDAGLTTLYCYMSATSRGCGNIVGGYWRAWKL
ncbi:protein MAIN-LIKE 2-like isoform X2 [Camellia sinensis]|uniref:protein MAIN-LIKE 2-like isoform X2 n=1 Tax=Camellia sinensis TaxID=4442 RepID=UPI0010360518|nr:protein MAIN-LIKE 2-like isoform X2 [Camellia sinensis]